MRTTTATTTRPPTSQRITIHGFATGPDSPCRTHARRDFCRAQAGRFLIVKANKPMEHMPKSIEDVSRLLEEHRYIADRGLAVSIFLGLRLAKPLFLEGEAGVGKTEVA